MVQCWKTDPLQRPLIRNVRVMLDNLLDTGGYIYLMDSDVSTADKLLRVHCSMQQSSKATQRSLPFKNCTALNPVGHNPQSV